MRHGAAGGHRPAEERRSILGDTAAHLFDIASGCSCGKAS